MPNEIELKYNITSPESGGKILESDFIKNFLIPNTKQTVNMKAVYYDDKEFTLSSKKIGYRIRKENDRFIATVKWSHSQSSSGLSVRSEYNVEIPDETADPYVFKGIINEEEILSCMLSITPLPIFTTEFTRELILLRYKNSVIEAAFDTGCIYTFQGKNTGICEFECELKEGLQEDLTAFGEELSDTFKLVPLQDSKLKRGFALIE